MHKKASTQSAFFSPRVVIALAISIATCSIVNLPLLAFLRPQGLSNASQRTLSFEERVSYQRAIEDVYWRHRIWPKERPDPKPSLDAVMSQVQLKRRLKTTCVTPKPSRFTGNDLSPRSSCKPRWIEWHNIPESQKGPSELFEALGNDPFVIAECLARPILARQSPPRFTNEQVKDTRLTEIQIAATSVATIFLQYRILRLAALMILGQAPPRRMCPGVELIKLQCGLALK